MTKSIPLTQPLIILEQLCWIKSRFAKNILLVFFLVIISPNSKAFNPIKYFMSPYEFSIKAQGLPAPILRISTAILIGVFAMEGIRMIKTIKRARGIPLEKNSTLFVRSICIPASQLETFSIPDDIRNHPLLEGSSLKDQWVHNELLQQSHSLPDTSREATPDSLSHSINYFIDNSGMCSQEQIIYQQDWVSFISNAYFLEEMGQLYLLKHKDFLKPALSELFTVVKKSVSLQNDSGLMINISEINHKTYINYVPYLTGNSDENKASFKNIPIRKEYASPAIFDYPEAAVTD